MPDEYSPQDKTGLGTDTKDTEAPSKAGAEGGEQAPNFRDSFLKDTDLYDNPSLSTFTDPVALAKAFVETKALVGKKGLILPTEKDPPEKWDEFYKALGRPETPDGYEIVKPEGLPKEMPYSEERVGDFKILAHKIGLSPTQVKELVNWQTAEASKEFSAFQGQFVQVDGLGLVPKQWIEDHNKAVDTFKSELGDKYEMLTKKAAIAVMKYGGQELKDFVDKTGFGDNPAFIRAWLKVAEATLTEDDLVESTSGSMSRKDRIAAINSDPALLDTSNLQKQRALVAERNKLIDEEYAESKR